MEKVQWNSINYLIKKLKTHPPSPMTRELHEDVGAVITMHTELCAMVNKPAASASDLRY